MKTLIELLAAGNAQSTCLSAPDSAPLTYSAFRQLSQYVQTAFNQVGIGRHDRVALVLPNGAEMAASFVTTACCCTSAPLNPSYRADEFEFYLNDLNAKALVVEKGSSSPALAVAAKMGIALIELEPTPTLGAGSFTLNMHGLAPKTAQHPGAAQADDVALVLHTSGTTSRPKIVPLTHRNVSASAKNIALSTRFSSSDRGLNVMPLFHIHGLIAGILAPLSQGGEVYCTSGFNAWKFFSQMDSVKPTWYTDVPTMHQAILSRSNSNKEVIARVPLRFIRSSSSSLPPQVLAELEATFKAPVIEAYGMTEAAHQMTCNPLPPGQRKPGSVGLAAGPEIAIMSAEGELLASGSTGEIVIRGSNVTLGYENNDKANSDAFTNGWFRTGDQGMIDEAGYVSITGRLKEIINRGGEKFSPREVDEVLMDHPAVAQVVCFGIPHDKLGEEVGAAVVLREGMTATEKELREYTAIRLADFKVPRKILLMDEIPKGATGKLQRIGIAQKLGLA
jgi:acyl-CoA synthetase (AMP-forming)/AMP-acid ligase II